MKVMEQTDEVRQHRLELARRAFHEFHAQCFWSYRQDAEITEADIPWIVRELWHYGGAKAIKQSRKYALRRLRDMVTSKARPRAWNNSLADPQGFGCPAFRT